MSLGWQLLLAIDGTKWTVFAGVNIIPLPSFNLTMCISGAFSQVIDWRKAGAGEVVYASATGTFSCQGTPSS
jgi:hypothetical protein